MSKQTQFTIKKIKGSSGNLIENNFERPSHTFLGWSTDPDATTATYTDKQKIVFTTDVDLYAVWKRYFDIIFNVSTATTQIKPQDQIVEDGKSYTVPVCNSVKTGHYFVKWDVNGEEYKNPAEVFTPTDDCLFTPVWRTNKTIKYNLNGGSGAIPANQTINSTSGITVASCSATKTDASFVGWNHDSTATTKQYSAGDNLKDTFDDDVYDLYAIWKTCYTIIFNYNGNGTSNETKYAEVDQSVTTPGLDATPLKSNYQFGGWSEYQDLHDQDEHEVIDAGDSVTPNSSKTYYAIWIPKYTITYNLNGMTGTTPTEQVVVRGDSITLPANNFTKEHTTANGWYVTNSDNSTSYYQNGQTITPTEDMIIYAKYNWHIKITFDTNSGNGLAPDDIWTSTGQFTFPACSATKSGYNFAGWSTSKTATEADNIAGDSKTVTSNKTYYAVWSLAYTTIPDCFVTTSTADGIDSSTREATKTVADNVYIPNGARITFDYTLKHNGNASDSLRFYLIFNGTTIGSTTTAGLPNKGTTNGSVTTTYNGTTATSSLSLYLYEVDTGCVGARLELTNIVITY